MIKAILVFNMRGQARLLKFFDSCPAESQQKLLREAFQIISKRDINSCNFIEYNEYKLVYRNYATLYFTFLIDSTESEYDVFELIHTFVQCLDQYFENVCELDLIFQSDKAAQILNEFFVDGFITDRNPDSVLKDVQAQVEIERQESGVLKHVGSKIKSAVNSKAAKMKGSSEKRTDFKSQ